MLAIGNMSIGEVAAMVVVTIVAFALFRFIKRLV